MDTTDSTPTLMDTTLPTVSETPTTSPEQPAVVQKTFIAASLPKACPPTPMIEAITAAETETTTYPEASTFDFQVSKKKRVDRNLDVFYVGIRDMYQRQWSFIIPSPPCFVTFTAVYKREAQNSRALLCPMYGDTTNPAEPAPMIAFLEHSNKISLALQEKMCTIDETFANDWVSPLKTQDSFLMGMNVRVKSDNVRNCIISCP